MASDSSKRDVEEFMLMMDAVEAIRSQDKAVEKQLSFDEEKESIKKSLRATYQQMGSNISESQLDRAVDNHFSKRWEFKPHEEGLTTTLAHAYVNRGKIARRGAVAAAALGVFAAGAFGLNAIRNAHQRGLERDVEVAVEQAYSSRLSLEQQADNLLKNPFIGQLPENEANRLRDFSSVAKTHLNTTDDFFGAFCPDGVSDDTITLSNYGEVEEKLDDAFMTLRTAESRISDGESIINTQQKFVLVKNGLDNLIEQVRRRDSPDVLENRAEVLYQDGISSIDNRQLPEAERKQRELAELNSGIDRFVTLSSSVEGLYGSIRETAIENAAKIKGNELYERAGRFIAEGNISGLIESASELQELDKILKQEYRITLVPDSEEKNGIDRYYDGRLSGYYFFVSAIDSNGRKIPLEITNEETKRVEEVTIWGEKVGDARYDEIWNRVVSDKKDNGHIDNSNVERGIENRYFAEKKRGYMSVQILMTDNDGDHIERRGQITRW